MAAEVARDSLSSLHALLPALDRLVATGGWLSNPGIRQVREVVLGRFDVPEALQCGTRGAALLGARASGSSPTAPDLHQTRTGAGQ